MRNRCGTGCNLTEEKAILWMGNETDFKLEIVDIACSEASDGGYSHYMSIYKKK